MPDLLDASVWLPLSAPGHVHHERAISYWNDEAADVLAFCRVTALALLRFLTNHRIVGSAALNGGEAWGAMRTWLSTPRVQWLNEPEALDELLGHWSAKLDVRGADWTDAYLAAFASASGCRLVAFDADFMRFPSLQFLHLSP